MKQTIVIAGAAGEGINTVELFIERILKQNGYELFSYKNYMSRVRGGYNFSTIVVSESPVFATVDKADIFIALNREAHDNAEAQMVSNGLLITEERMPDLKAVSRSKNAFAMAAVGAVLKIFGIHEDELHKIKSKKWADDVNLENYKSAKYGYDQFALKHLPPRGGEGRILINGNQAVAFGALSAGLSFYCAYPMAPSTGIMTTLATYEKEQKIIVEQAEDEIAAVMAAVGASSNGVRAMTGTSGGGFALMVETLGFAAVSETPVVICNVQRPGPATGLPTRTEQADLAFTVTASQGEFSRIVLAPLTVEDAFYDTHRAFNLADEFQVPVIILTDQLLADTTQTVERFDTASLKNERHLLEAVVEDYKRYDFTRVSGGRKYPGLDPQTLIMTDSHVHDEYGHVTEAIEPTIQLKQKFLNRTEAIKSALKKPELYGSTDYETLFITWGSTYGALREAVDQLNDDGKSVAMLAFSDVFPIHPDVMKPYLKEGVKVINVEGNAMNQFGMILRMETGTLFDHAINKYDGRPFTSQYIIEKFEVIQHD